MPGPLQGVRILDLSRLLPGPACTWYLQGLGATVDRVESTRTGDFTRLTPPFVDGAGAIYSSVSHGKRSMTLDLRHSEGAGVVRRLLPHYQVLVEGFRPGVLEASGLDPQDLLGRFPGLVIARLSGFGQTGPWKHRPGHDLNYIGLTGAWSAMATTEPGNVAIPPVQIADMGGALVAAMGIAAALFDAQRTGHGRVLDVSLTEAAMSLMAPHVPAFTGEGRSPNPGSEMLTGALAIYRTYACAEGGLITVGALEPKFQKAILAVTGTLDEAGLVEAFAKKPRDHWVDLLPEGCVGPVLEPSELADHPQHQARRAVTRSADASWIQPPLAEEPLTGPVPGHGEHTDEILADAGFSTTEIASLRAAGTIK
jgi:alpha-methylacyl-CoA racemase